jgi:hypothetical protein
VILFQPLAHDLDSGHVTTNLPHLPYSLFEPQVTNVFLYRKHGYGVN